MKIFEENLRDEKIFEKYLRGMKNKPPSVKKCSRRVPGRINVPPLSPIKKLYDHATDQVIDVRILQLKDREGFEYKCIAPFAYLELMEMVGHRLQGFRIFLQKADPVSVNWIYI